MLIIVRITINLEKCSLQLQNNLLFFLVSGSMTIEI